MESHKSTMEQMAMAVLRGDYDAARMLADTLLADTEGGQLTPILRKGVIDDISRVKAVVFYPANADLNDAETTTIITEWLRSGGGNTLVLIGAERLELYELPPQSEPAPAVEFRLRQLNVPRHESEGGG